MGQTRYSCVSPSELSWVRHASSPRLGKALRSDGKLVLFGGAQYAVYAETFGDLTICRREEIYADRGMLEVDPVTNVPRANLAPL